MNCLIVLNYNDFEMTKSFIEQVENFEVIDKIIVVDNSSTDNSFEILKELNSYKVDVIRTDANEGYAIGNNFGVKYANRNYKIKNFIISNPDIIVQEVTLINLIEKLNESHNVAAISGQIVKKNGETFKNSCWKLPTYADLLIESSVLISKFFNNILNKGIYSNFNYKNNTLEYTDVLSGCFFVIKNSAFKEVGLFSDKTFLYYEENILFYNLKKFGYKSIIARDERIIHLHGHSISKEFKSLIKKNNILKESAIEYMTSCLKCNKIQIKVYEYLNKIFLLEKYMMAKILLITK